MKKKESTMNEDQHLLIDLESHQKRSYDGNDKETILFDEVVDGFNADHWRNKPTKKVAEDDVLQSLRDKTYEDLERKPYPDSNSTSSKTIISMDLVKNILNQFLAIMVGTILIIVEGIPFGSAYFPISWTGDGDSDSSSTPFPVPGKEIFGLRLFLFSTMMCQIIFTFTSQFTNPSGLQIVENVPFYHAIASICFNELGYGIEALSNLILILAFTSVLVGISFYALGALQLGKVIYFIPKHVLGKTVDLAFFIALF